MKFSTPILAGLLSISSTALGNIVGMTLPKQLSVDESFNCWLNSAGNARKITYVSVAFGAAPIKDAREKMLGTAILGQKTFTSHLRNLSAHGHNISVPLYVPADFPKGKTVVTAALYSVQHTDYGKNIPSISYLTATVNVTNARHPMNAMSVMDDRDDVDDDEDDDDDDDKDDDDEDDDDEDDDDEDDDDEDDDDEDDDE